MANTKMVIVMRTDLNMRKGKMVAQGAHAAMAILTNLKGKEYPAVLNEWLESSYTKICVGVGSEEELNAIHRKAQEDGLLCSYIVDNGQTEFGGVKTPTCVAIGPDYSDKVDSITGHLKLL